MTNMAFCVSNLNNAELESLLKDILGDSSTADKKANESDLNIFDDSDIAGICNKVADTMDIDVAKLETNLLGEEVVDQSNINPNQIYSSKDVEIDYLKLRIDILSKKLVDKTNESQYKDEELLLTTCKLNNAVKANERLLKKLTV